MQLVLNSAILFRVSFKEVLMGMKASNSFLARASLASQTKTDIEQKHSLAS